MKMSRSTLFEELYYARKVTPKPEYDESSLHSHQKYEVLHFEAGNAELIFENKKVLLHPGTLLLIPPATRHRINILSDLTYKRAVINFSKLPSYIVTTLFEMARVLHIAEDKRILNVLGRMQEYHELFDDEQKAILLEGLVTELLLLVQKFYTVPEIPATEYGQLMTQALAYIDKHLNTISNIEELCETLHVSRAFLYREFQNALGVSPMRYIHQKRLWVAHNLLRSGEDATKVCFGCGYREYSAFYRAYRNLFGYSPQETKNL